MLHCVSDLIILVLGFPVGEWLSHLIAFSVFQDH